MDKEKFSIKRRIKAFGFAFNGLGYFFKTVHNSWIHLVAAIVAIGSGFYFNITLAEWLWLIAVIFMVLITETINTAIEKVVDLVTDDYHKLAKRAKDLAAAAVLLAAFFAIVVAIIIFYPYLFKNN